MAKRDMNAMMKKRMSATQQASELQTSDEAYQQLFQKQVPKEETSQGELPIDHLHKFFTADIGFKPYPLEKLKAFAEQLREEGLLVKIIVRPMVGGEDYEILSGHNRVSAAKLAGWETIGAEIVDADDDRAIVIATSTNLIQRQNLSIIERGKAYKALLDAKNRQGARTDKESGTSGENRQKYSARKLVAEFFGVSEYEIRKAAKLTQLIPALADVLENAPKRMNLACADLVADYDAESQEAFAEMFQIEGVALNKEAMKHIVKQCPPPTAQKQAIFAAWREARAKREQQMSAPPKKLTFERKRFAPYLESLGGDAEVERLFLEFLQGLAAQKSASATKN